MFVFRNLRVANPSSCFAVQAELNRLQSAAVFDREQEETFSPSDFLRFEPSRPDRDQLSFNASALFRRRSYALWRPPRFHRGYLCSTALVVGSYNEGRQGAK